VTEHVSLQVDSSAVAALKAGLAAGLEAFAEDVVRRAERGKPKGSHTEIVATVHGNQIDIAASWDGPALLKEHGTVGHIEEPKNKKALKLGDKGFAAVVHHPGTHAEPFINPALVEAAGSALPTIAAGVARKYR
jgi:hypothetical protein